MSPDPATLIVALDHVSVAPSPVVGRVVITLTMTCEAGETTMLDVVLRVVDAIIRRRGDDPDL